MVDFHSETIDLPSKGWYYPPDSPLASGQLDIKHMTAEHEDILTSANLIAKGIVVDKFLEAMIANKDVKYQDLLLGDKSAVIIASRILGYGKMYTAQITCKECSSVQEVDVDLTTIDDKKIDFDPKTKGTNLFKMTLPTSGKTVEFRLLTVKDESEINKDIQALKKINGDVSAEITTRIRKCLVSVDGKTDPGTINLFSKAMPVRDSKAFRDYVKSVTPDIDLTIEHFCDSCGNVNQTEVGIDPSFFWPDL